MNFGQKALEVLMDEIELEKLGVGHTHHDMPRSGDEQEQGKARRNIQRLEHSPFTQKEDPGADHHARDDDADQAFGQDRQRGEGIKTPQIEPALQPRGLVRAHQEKTGAPG